MINQSNPYVTHTQLCLNVTFAVQDVEFSHDKALDKEYIVIGWSFHFIQFSTCTSHAVFDFCVWLKALPANLVGSSDLSTTLLSAYKPDVTNSLYTWGIPCLGMSELPSAEQSVKKGYTDYSWREGVFVWAVDTWDCEWILLVLLRHSVFRVKWWIRIYSKHLIGRKLFNHHPNQTGVNLSQRSQRWWLMWKGRDAITKERFWER